MHPLTALYSVLALLTAQYSCRAYVALARANAFTEKAKFSPPPATSTVDGGNVHNLYVSLTESVGSVGFLRTPHLVGLVITSQTIRL